MQVSPNEVGEHERAERSLAKRFNFGVPNVYERDNLLKTLLTEGRLEAAIAEAEAAYKKASQAAHYRA